MQTSKSKKPVLYAMTGGLCVAIIIAGYIAYRHFYPATDDAYIQANTVNIATQVSGPVENIYVQDHQAVKAGQLLFTIDPEPFILAKQKAAASLIQTEAELDTQQKDTARILPLVAKGQLSRSEGDDAKGKLDQLKAALQVAQAELAEAALNLQYTRISAPADGRITNFILRKGQYVAAGDPQFALVENNPWWVDANFKETDLERIRIGQKADIQVDIYPSIKFKGVVQGISAGSGAAFALLPPENATGNWVKVTQRFPVRVNFVNPDPRYPLRVGASCTVTVDTR